MDFINAIEVDFGKLLAAAGIAAKLAHSAPKQPSAASESVVTCDAIGDGGFNQRGAFTADVLVDISVYRADDSAGASFDALAVKAENALFAPDLHNALNALSGVNLCYLGWRRGESFTSSADDSDVRALTFQLRVWFTK